MERRCASAVYLLDTLAGYGEPWLSLLYFMCVLVAALFAVTACVRGIDQPLKTITETNGKVESADNGVGFSLPLMRPDEFLRNDLFAQRC